MKTRNEVPRFIGAFMCGAVVCVSAATAYAAETATPVTAPKYQSLRYEEDWSVLRSGGTGDLFDPLKFVRLSSDGRFWASFGGQIRERVEGWDAFNFGATGTADEDDVFLLHRLRAHMDVHAGQMFRAFVEVKSSLSTDRDLPARVQGGVVEGGTRTLDVDDFDIQNAFLDVRVPLGEKDSFTLRGGRQEMLMGNERLVSPLDWTNTRRTFDGVSGIWKILDWRVQSFYTHLVEVYRHNWNEPYDDVQFWGAYASKPQPFGPQGPAVLDVYWLALESGDAVSNNLPITTNRPQNAPYPVAGEEERQTVGVRIAGPIPSTDFDYETEGAYQFGDIGGADVSAYMVMGEIGWGLPKTKVAPRVVAGFDYASGDDNPNDRDVETFNQLFPLGHKYLGYVDIVGRQNIIDARLQTGFVPVGTLRAGVDLHNFWRASDDDGLYNASGALVRGRDGYRSEESFVGSELDLTLRQPIGRHFDALVGYSHFFAGDFIRDTGAHEDIDFVYLQGQYTF